MESPDIICVKQYVFVLFCSDAASKHAVQAFFDCLRAEVQQYGIIVSTVNHTFINTITTEDETKSTGTSESTTLPKYIYVFINI